MKIQGKIEDNAEAFKSEDLFTHHFLVDWIHSDSQWRLRVRLPYLVVEGT